MRTLLQERKNENGTSPSLSLPSHFVLHEKPQSRVNEKRNEYQPNEMNINRSASFAFFCIQLEALIFAAEGETAPPSPTSVTASFLPSSSAHRSASYCSGVLKSGSR